MSVYLEKSRSCWMDDAPRDFPALDTRLSCDVVVIGSGIAGLSIAYELAASGRKVVVLDRGPIGRGMTARTSAHLTSACDDFYHAFIDLRGEDVARLHFASHAAAIARIGAIAADEEIACDYQRLEARLFLAGDAKEPELDREQAALAKVGLAGVAKRTAVGRHRLSDGPCLIIPGQGRFHPQRYLDGLARRLAERGTRLYANTPVVEVADADDGVLVRTASGVTVTAGCAVIAANGPIGDHLSISGQETPFRTYVLAAEVASGSIEDVLYWDTEEPYHYVRLHPWGDHDLLLVGGEDHRSGEADDADQRFLRLEAWARDRFPEMGRVRYRWSGQCLETPDFAAFIGKRPGSERVYLVSGDSGQGITHGVVASLIVPQLIATGDHRWAAVYDPARKPPHAIATAVEAALGAARGMLGRFVGGEVSSVDDLMPGAGGILREGMSRFAVCRDEQGKVHRLSEACAHAGCAVRWNSFEQCWDCPCHGSQFAPDGTVLNAPAVKSLTAEPAAQERTPARVASQGG